jgi:hypothetical protein
LRTIYYMKSTLYQISCSHGPLVFMCAVLGATHIQMETRLYFCSFRLAATSLAVSVSAFLYPHTLLLI